MYMYMFDCNYIEDETFLQAECLAVLLLLFKSDEQMTLAKDLYMYNNNWTLSSAHFWSTVAVE